MNHRSLAVAAMRGDPVDHMPFIARMDLWFDHHRGLGTLPERYRHASLWDLQRDLGVGILEQCASGRSFCHLERSFPVDVTETRGRVTIEYRTPYGTLRACDVMAEAVENAAMDGARVEYPLKSVEDYDALQYVFEHTNVVETLDACGQVVREIGNDGLVVPWTGRLPAHQLMIDWMGYEKFYYELHDHPLQVERALEALTAVYRRVMELAVQSPSDAIEMGGNYDEDMTPPPIFERFFAPLYRDASVALSEKGKALVIHGDGNMQVLLQKLMECGIQVVEAVTPKPMTSIDVAHTRALWKDRVTMWGGVPCVLLTDVFSEEQFEQYLEGLFRAVAPGDRFILGLGDNVPTDALWDRVLRLIAFWREHGAYPIRV
jgi:uroporphyrinogen-III decarboxylase